MSYVVVKEPIFLPDWIHVVLKQMDLIFVACVIFNTS